MEQRRFARGDVLDDPDLTEWSFVIDDFPLGAVGGILFKCALGAPLGPKSEALEYPLLRHFFSDGVLWKAHWRDGAAVVVDVNDMREVHAIVRHGSVLRLIRLRR